MPPDPTERFVRLVQGPEGDLPLDEAALLIAAHADAAVEVDAALRELDRIAAACPAPTFEAWRRHLYVDLGFAGDEATYRDPRNSLLHEVLARRRGIPITLAVVGIEVGRRLGLRLLGVGMPGHFLLRPETPAGVFVDPFAGGEVLDAAGCEARFRRIHGPRPPFSASYLDPVGHRAILVRMLNNLRALYSSRGQTSSLTWVLRLRSSIPGVPAEERAELGRALGASGRFAEAAEELEALAQALPHVAPELAREATAFRAKLN